jgi:hypothetical protein
VSDRDVIDASVPKALHREHGPRRWEIIVNRELARFCVVRRPSSRGAQFAISLSPSNPDAPPRGLARTAHEAWLLPRHLISIDFAIEAPVQQSRFAERHRFPRARGPCSCASCAWTCLSYRKTK